ncbi:MAG: hypothetical protein SNG27_07990 [Rikenellaceae bacterium]
MRGYLTFLFSLILAFFTFVSYADDTPYIVELEANEQYMGLLNDVNSLSSKEDSLAVVLAHHRTQYKMGGESKDSNRAQIVEIEQSLLDLRVQKNALKKEMNLIEQQWNLENINQSANYIVIRPIDSNEDKAKFISQSTFAKKKLSPEDLNNLRNAENLSLKLALSTRGYISNYEELARLKQEYNQASTQKTSDSVALKHEIVDSLNMLLGNKISTRWSDIVDAKGFAYGLLMEKAGYADFFEIEERLKIRSAEMVDSLIDNTQCVELLEYHFGHLSMVKLEMEVAQRLHLPVALDSLKGVRDSLRFVEFNLPNVDLEERFFIDYEPIKFSTKAIYNAANPIPKCKVYERGVIYRLLVGTFKTRQAATLFRGASPISTVTNDQGSLCYYIGGYKTLEEAEEAREVLLKRGFKRPEVVEWRNGNSQNLTQKQSQKPQSESESTLGYRVEIASDVDLSEDVRTIIKTHGEGRELSKIGASVYVVGIFDTHTSATNLVEKLKEIDETLSVVVKEIK